jgi:hypothetical protein
MTKEYVDVMDPFYARPGCFRPEFARREETAKRQDLDRLAHCSASKPGFITVVGHAAMISAGRILAGERRLGQ